jgi:6-phosphogluconolactonase
LGVENCDATKRQFVEWFVLWSTHRKAVRFGGGTDATGRCDNQGWAVEADLGERAQMERVTVGRRWRKVRALAAGAGLALLLATTGCGAFFQCEGKADCGTSGSGTGSNSGDYLYANNVPNNPEAVSVYDVSSGTLTAVSGSPFSLNAAPIALAVSPNNNFLYSATANGIYIYSLASTGIPSNANNGSPVDDGYPIIAMAMSPDGNYLFTIEEQITYVIEEYSVNTSTGFVSPLTSVALPAGATCALAGGSSTPATASCGLAVSPSGQFVIAAAGTSGDIIYPYSSSTGITNASNPQGISAPSTTDGELSVAVDSSNYAYIAETSSMSSYAISSSGVPNSSGSLTSYKFTGNETPRSAVVSNGFVYTADQGTNTISAFTSTAGVLTALGSEIAGPTAVSAIGVDNSGKYLAAEGYSSSIGLQLFSITSGALQNLNQNAATGTNYAYPVAMALTH